jgi:hypothetical protein
MVAHDTVASELSAEQYGKAVSDARTAVLQAVGGLLLAAGAVATRNVSSRLRHLRSGGLYEGLL